MPQGNYQRGTARDAQEIFAVRELSTTNFADMAEKVIQKHAELRSTITSTQLRGLFALMTELREMIRVRQVSVLDTNLMSHVQYIKMRFAYAAGRESSVKIFMQQTRLIECLDTVRDSVRQFEMVCKYAEALVAYHKYYIGDKK